MNSQAETSFCGDPMRALLYARVGRYFEKTDEDESKLKTGDGPCAICGADLVGAMLAGTDGKTVCQAQRAITQKRSRPAPGHPLAFGVPNDPTSFRNAMNEIGCIVLVAADGTFVATNVIPTAPLPPEMTAIRVVPGATREFFRSFVASPPKPPFLLVQWARKAAIRLEETESLRRVALCGDDEPVYFDIEEVARLVGIAERIGGDGFKKAVALRGRVSRPRDPADVEKANVEMRTLLRGPSNNAGLTLAEFKSLPVKTDPAYRIAMAVAGEAEDPDKEAEPQRAA